MNRSAALGAVVLIALATPALSQGRFGSESAQRAADRVERDAIRRAEHPEPHQPAAQATAPEPAPEHAPAAGPITEPAPPPAQ